MSNSPVLDALIVGAGFGGIYQLHTLLSHGLKNVKVIDAAGDVGGTWYWNRYPGAMSDTESYIYRFSWDKEDLMQYHWKEHYVKQPEVLAYLEHVVEKHGLRKYMQFNTQLTLAHWDDEDQVWVVETNHGKSETLRARYVVTALGLLSKTNWPDIPGIRDFKGEMYHTGKWPQHHDFTSKRVGIIGNGSTGVQIITAIAPQVAHLITFQRNPQYSVPSGDGPISREYRQQVNTNYESIWKQVRNSNVAFGFEESTVPAMSVPAEERERKFEEAWQKGNGFRFMFWTFSDLTTNEEANREACEFIKRKIRSIVKDPGKAEKLMPTQLYARRPLCDAGYYEQFNRENIEVVDIKTNPITRIKEKGLETADGTNHELDVIIFATGFDAVDGNYTRVAIKGRQGKSLKEHWDSNAKTGGSGPTTYLGVCVAGFPNLFMITGPNSPFTNIPPTLETQVEFIGQMIAKAERDRTGEAVESNGDFDRGQVVVVEATQEAEDGWTDLCNELSAESLFRKTDSWVFGANVPGKKHAVMFYFGGLRKYREELDKIIEGGWKGFKPF